VESFAHKSLQLSIKYLLYFGNISCTFFLDNIQNSGSSDLFYCLYQTIWYSPGLDMQILSSLPTQCIYMFVCSSEQTAVISP
jgi:hypothetical protein